MKVEMSEKEIKDAIKLKLEKDGLKKELVKDIRFETKRIGDSKVVCVVTYEDDEKVSISEDMIEEILSNASTNPELNQGKLFGEE